MVRKRTRRYSSDSGDSDVDFAVSNAEPAPKKYSLRQRKTAPLMPPEFDYFGLEEEDDDRDEEDEDFNYEEEYAIETEPDFGDHHTEPPVHQTSYEPSYEADIDGDGLIDFEDVIRADIVCVNQEPDKDDYDNILAGTVIKTNPLTKSKIKNSIESVPPPPESESIPEETEAHLEAKEEPEVQPKSESQEQEQEQEPTQESEAVKYSNGDTTEDTAAQETETPKETENEEKPNSPKAESKTDAGKTVINDVCTIEDDDEDDVIVVEPKPEIIVLDDD